MPQVVVKVIWIAGGLIIFPLLFSAAALAQTPQAPQERVHQLNQQVLRLYEQGKYQEAMALSKEALALGEKTLGPMHPDVAQSLNDLAALLQTTGDVKAAQPLHERALNIREKALGPNHPDVAESLNNLAELLAATGDYAKARPLHERALKIREKALPPTHPDLAQSLNNLALLLETTGEPAKARPLYERALKIVDQALDPTHPYVIATLGNLSRLLQATGDYAGARLLDERLLKLDEQMHGPESPEVATDLHHLATVLRLAREHAAARPLYERALKIRQQALGPAHPDVAISLNDLGVLLADMGDYAGARPLYERALKINEKALGPTSLDVAQNLSNLAFLLQTTGDYAGARPLSERALKIREQRLGPMHRDVATSLNDLGALLADMADYAAARPLHERALKIREQVVGPKSLAVATSLNNLGRIAFETGDYATARLRFEQTLKIREEALGATHLDVAQSVNNLAVLLQTTGDYAGARPLYERALKIREQTLGPVHQDVAQSLNNLAGVLEDLGDYAAARPLFERALRVREQTLGPTHPAVATDLNNLAYLLRLTRNYADARPLYERALKIHEQAFGPSHPRVASSLNNLAELLKTMGDYAEARPLYERALTIREETLQPGHPDIAAGLHNLGLLVWEMGDVEQAARLLGRAVSLVERHARRGLLGMAERQKLAFLRTTEFFVADYLSLPPAVLPASAAYAAVLARKNLVFRVLGEERAALGGSTDPAVRRLAEKRLRLGQTLAGLATGTGGDPAERRRRAVEVEKELEQVETELSRASAGFREEQAEAQATSQDVCQTLPSNHALLDYVQYQRFTPHHGKQPSRVAESYTIFILRAGQCAELQRIELGPAEPIHRAARAFRESLTSTRKIRGKEEPLAEADVVAKAQALSALILPPSVRRSLTGFSTVLVAPDGPLALVPFKLLPGEGGHPFLVETHVVATIPSGRDLLRLMRTKERGQSSPAVVLVGNPDFGAAVVRTGGDMTRATVRAGCGLHSAAAFDPLPGTAAEVRAIANQATSALKTMALHQAEGRTATEFWLSQAIAGKRYVHLATHGYFAGEDCTPPGALGQRGVSIQAGMGLDQAGPVGTNPLLLSGIALAGANRRAQAETGADDGILTALEVTGLDLRGTELVVLSACETGLGAQYTGQELVGLRWAFGMAGARSLLTSLWKVPDEPTVRLMTKFYGYLWRSPKDGGPLGKAAALRQAQLDLMKENRARFNGDSRPNDWGAWVLSGDWR